MNSKSHFIKIDKINRDSKESLRYLEEYYAMRAKAFSEQLGSPRYKPEPSAHDLDPNTIFLLAVADNNKVVGGCQVIFSTPQNRKRLKFESPYDSLKIENLLPHMDTKGLAYAELAGVAVDSSANGLGLGLKLQKEIAHMVKNGKCPADVIIGRVTPQNVSIVLKAARDEAMPVVVRDDINVKVEGMPRVIMMFSAKEDFPLLSDKMKKAGVGMPGDVFLLKHVQRKRDVKREALQV